MIYLWIRSGWIALWIAEYSSFEKVSSDHKIITAKIRLSLCKNKKWRYKEVLYSSIEISKIPYDEYDNFVTTHIEATAECILSKPRVKCRVSWESIVLRHHVPSGFAGCRLFPPSPPVKAGHTRGLWFADAIQYYRYHQLPNWTTF